MKKITLALVLLFSVTVASHAQVAEVKVNAAAGALAIFNPSIEVGFGKYSAVSLDFIGAFAEKDYLGTGFPMLMSYGLMGYRFYIKPDVHKGFFVGADLGFNTFKMNKDIVPFVANDGGGRYDVGYGVVMGGTVGYKFLFKERWGVELSVSYGWQHSQHEGYNLAGQKLFDMNASAEWLPYKAGIYITYRLGKPRK